MRVPGRSPGISPQDPRGSEGIIPSFPGDLVSEVTARTFMANFCSKGNVAGHRRGRQFACGSVSRLPEWHTPAIHDTRMMARAERSGQVSSVARKISSGSRINNLQGSEKIFEQSVALRSCGQRIVDDWSAVSVPLPLGLNVTISATFEWAAMLSRVPGGCTSLSSYPWNLPHG